MEFEMTAVFHYGKDSKQYIRRFQEKRLDYATLNFIIIPQNNSVPYSNSPKIATHWSLRKIFSIIL